MNVIKIWGLMSLNCALYLVPFVYTILVLNKEPEWLSSAVVLDLSDAQRTAPMYCLAVVIMTCTAFLLVTHTVWRSSSKPSTWEYCCLGVCVVPLIWSVFVDANARDDAIILATIATVYNICVAFCHILYPASVPSKLAYVSAWIVASSLVITSVSNVSNATQTWFEPLHSNTAGIAFLASFPMVVCLRSQRWYVVLYLSIASIALCSMMVSVDGPLAGIIHKHYILEFVGHSMLSLAFAMAVVT